jgi:DNA polymerase-3 subunit epsilon/ATP-dependent DNA helicase DinG
MKDSIVALDLETTGLDVRRDAVIEIGAVHFRGSRIEDTWSTLVNPGRPLPPMITALTGIDDSMLAGAPRISSVLAELESFVGDYPILGHNVGFDLGFLNRKGLFQSNLSLDTFDIASVLLPSAGRYSLTALASRLGVPVQTSHRALDDAMTTAYIYMQLYEQALQLPYPLLHEIARLGEAIAWGADWLFEAALEDASPQENTDERTVAIPWTTASTEDQDPATALRPSQEPQPLNIDETSAILEPGGPFAKEFPGYEHRPQQITMTRAVSEAISQKRHLLVEAGTGIGKSMAYLVPAFAWARRNGQRVVISTNTINLQDQLIHKDIPDLREIMAEDYRAAVLKGRSNYLCPRRFDALRKLGPRSPEEMRVLAKILVWLAGGGSGDRAEINLPLGEGAVWNRLSAEGEACSLDDCLRYMRGACPFYKAHAAAEHAHVVIVNHALLLADIATGNRVIPEYEVLIVDEAHHLESATTQGLSFNVGERDVIYQLRDLSGKSGGLIHQILDVGRDALPAESFQTLQRAANDITDRTKECTDLARRLFQIMSDFMTQRREGKPVGPYGQRVRIVPSTRTLPDWSQVEIAWEDLRGPLARVVQGMDEMSEGLTELMDMGVQPAENLALAAGMAARSLREVFENLDQMIFEPDPQTIYWIELSSSSEALTLHAAPLEVGPLVERHLWHKKESVVMTSATLTTAGEFDYIRNRLNADDADDLALGSPFDFESSTLLYLINDIPEPRQRQSYQRSVERGLNALCKATDGRTLALFTSHQQLRRTARAISDSLGAQGIHVFQQSAGASRHALLEDFRTTEQAVLLGTRSFWEGVDVPGEALSVLAIIRLPFDVPNDPIIAARAETYENPFYQFTVPEAILRFRQGFGRLIRTQSDRGVVAVFDSRVLSKNYGRAFIDSLPRCTVRTGPLAELPNAARRWLNL